MLGVIVVVIVVDSVIESFVNATTATANNVAVLVDSVAKTASAAQQARTHDVVAGPGKRWTDVPTQGAPPRIFLLNYLLICSQVKGVDREGEGAAISKRD